MIAVIAVVLALFLFFWIHQSVQLMCLSDADFPGRYDKVLWAAGFGLLFFATPIAFFVWKQVYRNMRE